MQIIQYLNLAAEQHRMSDYPEDKLDLLVRDALDRIETLSPDELEQVQAASLPFGMRENDLKS